MYTPTTDLTNLAAKYANTRGRALPDPTSHQTLNVRPRIAQSRGADRSESKIYPIQTKATDPNKNNNGRVQRENPIPNAAWLLGLGGRERMGVTWAAASHGGRRRRRRRNPRWRRGEEGSERMKRAATGREVERQPRLGLGFYSRESGFFFLFFLPVLALSLSLQPPTFLQDTPSWHVGPEICGDMWGHYLWGPHVGGTQAGWEPLTVGGDMLGTLWIPPDDRKQHEAVNGYVFIFRAPVMIRWKMIRDSSDLYKMNWAIWSKILSSN